MSFSSKPKALATLGVYRKLVHILEVYHKKEVVINCEKQIKKGVLMINTSRGEIIDTNALIEGIENEQEVIHIDHNNVIKNRDLLILKAYLNVIELTHSGECGLFFIKLSSSPDLYSIIVLSLLFEGMCCYE